MHKFYWYGTSTSNLASFCASSFRRNIKYVLRGASEVNYIWEIPFLFYFAVEDDGFIIEMFCGFIFCNIMFFLLWKLKIT